MTPNFSTSARRNNPTVPPNALTPAASDSVAGRILLSLWSVPWTPILVVGCGAGIAGYIVRAILRFEAWKWMVR